MLSTSDNPYNPWTQWDDWFAWDATAGYNTCDYLARFTNTLSSVDDEAREALVQLAVLEIVEINITGTFIYVPKPEQK